MKKKTVPAILIHMDWTETIKCLSHEQIGAFIIAMLDYANTGKEPKFKDNSMQALFISFKKQIDRDRKSYEEFFLKGKPNSPKIQFWEGNGVWKKSELSTLRTQMT